MYVGKNKVVTFHYTLRLESGRKIVSTISTKPLQILVGYHHVIQGLEDAIMGMEVGNKKRGTIDPKDAYGLVDKKLLKVYPRKIIPGNIDLKKNRKLIIRMKNGQQEKVVIKSFDETNVVLDCNHPHAGEKLSFKTMIVHVREATQEEIQSGILT